LDEKEKSMSLYWVSNFPHKKGVGKKRGKKPGDKIFGEKLQNCKKSKKIQQILNLKHNLRTKRTREGIRDAKRRGRLSGPGEGEGRVATRGSSNGRGEARGC
jgi:hypothetical protein